MKVSINQVKINRVGINTAQVRGIRLGSASKGGQTSPFHPSLVDYWNFKGKINYDKDRNTIKGIKGEILTAYNFGWSLGSGYGLFKENYLTYRKVQNVFVTGDHSITIMNFVPANTWILFKYGTEHLNTTRVRVTGLTANNQLAYGYSPTNDGARVLMAIPSDGEYDLPESVVNTTSYNVGFIVQNALTKNVTIEQIPEYEGAIVTDGIDDYLKLGKVGYKVGTVIIKHKPVRLFNGWQYVLETSAIRTYMVYNFTDENINTNFDNYNTVGDYGVGIINTPRLIETPFYIGCQSKIKEFLSMALYEIAIYQDVLTDEEIQKEINVMQYDTPNPVFALNFDNFAYKAVDYPDFATGKVTTNKIVVNSTTATFNGIIATATNPEADTGEPIEVPAYKLKISGMDAYNMPEDFYFIAVLGANISGKPTQQWVQQFSKDGIYNIPAITLEDNIYNISIAAMIGLDKPIEIEVLYDKNITKSFPENKQIFP
ncbi:hypothetical protein [Bacteroides fragilis]|uniref:hypothetical protein n=1 Tax=Bacteroides fragilis TaxID=817 RepID=UPI0039B3FD8B